MLRKFKTVPAIIVDLVVHGNPYTFWLKIRIKRSLQPAAPIYIGLRVLGRRGALRK